MKRENGIVEIESTDFVIGTFIFEDEVDTLICNNQSLVHLQAPNVKNIIANNNQGLQTITAPNAITIESQNCGLLRKINAPNCTHLKCENTPILFLDKVSVAKNCDIQTGGDLKFESEKYAYVETKEGLTEDITRLITKEKGLLDWELSEYAVLRGDFWHYKGKLFTTAEIVFCDRNDITSIEAPNARYISCENCKNLKEINAPNCTHIYCKGSDKLNLYNMKFFPTCKVRELGEIGVFIGQAESIKKNEEEYIRIYKVVERDKNEKIDEIETRYFFTKEEAEYYANIKDVNVGNSNVIETFEAKKSSFTNDMFQEKFKSLEDLFDKHSELFDFQDEEVIKYNQGESILGDIVVAWSWEKYTGYGRNLEGVGVAGLEGTFGYYKLKTEADLITGNEESTYKTNYSLLLSYDEIKEELGHNYTEDELRELINEKLSKSHWLWNDFKNNPDSKNIREDIEKVIKNRVGIYAFIEQENGKRKDISFHFDETNKSILDIENDGYTGTLKTNVTYLYCKNNELEAIEAERTIKIHCEGNEQLERIYAEACQELHCNDCPELEKIYAPECQELYCENCPELKEENMELSYDCEIEGLGKKNQLKR